MKLDGLLDMAGKAASKVLDKDGDGKVTMTDISQGMKDAAEQNLIPANMKPLYDSLNVSEGGRSLGWWIRVGTWGGCPSAGTALCHV